MKKIIRLFIPIILAVAILCSCFWYLFSYDQAFTRETLLGVARFCQKQSYHGLSTCFYDLAYNLFGNNDAVAIELAQQYISIGNYTKAEYTLQNAIRNKPSAELYIALSKTFVEQDKLLDAVELLDGVTDPAIKSTLDAMRPSLPSSTPEPNQYNQYITVEFAEAQGTLYASADGIYPSVNEDLYNEPFALSEGETQIYAVTVADNGLVSSWGNYKYTIGGIIRPVTFADAEVEAVVRDMLMIESPVVVYTNDLWKIKEFTIPEDAVDYSDIALMTYLEKLTAENAVSTQLSHLFELSELTQLHITGCTVTTEMLGKIAQLPKLKALTLSDCDLSTITALNQASSLEYLDLSNNAVRNLEPLGRLTNLQELYLSHNAVADLGTISALENLTALDVSYNALTSLDNVVTLTALTWLNADNNGITQIDQINALSRLTYLSVNTNQISSITAVAECTELTELYVAENQLTDITALSKLTKLMYLDFSNNAVKTVPTWSKNCALISIIGTNNKIKSLAPLAGLKSLNIINMEYNKEISSVKELADCPLLVHVNVYGSKVKDVSALEEHSVIVDYTPV